MFLVSLLIALVASPAGAATVVFSVHGLKRVRSVVVVADDGSGVQVVPCRDDGQEFDPTIDGIWTCDSFTATGAEVWSALLTDSEAVRVGAVPISSSRLEVGLEKTSSGVVVETGPQEIAPSPNAQAATPGLILLTRLRSAAAQGAPMLQVQTEDMVVEHPCRDDGEMFDEKLNDGSFLCAGFLPGPGSPEEFATTISLRMTNGESRELVTLNLTGGSGIRFAEIDASSQHPPKTGGFFLHVLPGTASVDAQLGRSGQAGGPDTGAGFEPGHIAPVTSATPDRAIHGPPNHGARKPPQPTVSEGPWRLVSLLLVLGVSLVWLRGRVQRLVPAALEPVSAPRLGRVGPRPGGEPVGLVVTDIPSALNHLVSHLSGHRRVVLLGLDGVPDGLPVGHPVYTVRNAAMADALEAIQGLIRSPGAPVAVIIARPAQLDPDASVSPVALTEFYEALDALVWSVTLQGPQDETRPSAKRWVLEADGSWSEG